MEFFFFFPTDDIKEHCGLVTVCHVSLVATQQRGNCKDAVGINGQSQEFGQRSFVTTHSGTTTFQSERLVFLASQKPPQESVKTFKNYQPSRAATLQNAHKAQEMGIQPMRTLEMYILTDYSW